MVEILCNYFLLFILYSFIGWLMEEILTFIDTKKFVNRGFLIGPICPIYGYGCLLIIILLRRYINDPIALFVMAVVLCFLLEYFTSYFMEKFFKARWWDYSQKKFNINGRICLDNMIAFGALGVIVIYIVNPFLMNIISYFNNITLYIVSGILLVIYLVDNIISFKVISGFSSVAKTVKKDSTEEITKKVREALTLKGGLYKRLVSAFNFKASDNLLKKIKNQVTQTINKQADKVKVVIEKQSKKNKELRKKVKLEYQLRINKLKEKVNQEKQKKKEELNKLK